MALGKLLNRTGLAGAQTVGDGKESLETPSSPAAPGAQHI